MSVFAFFVIFVLFSIVFVFADLSNFFANARVDVNVVVIV